MWGASASLISMSLTFSREFGGMVLGALPLKVILPLTSMWGTTFLRILKSSVALRVRSWAWFRISWPFVPKTVVKLKKMRKNSHGRTRDRWDLTMLFLKPGTQFKCKSIYWDEHDVGKISQFVPEEVRNKLGRAQWFLKKRICGLNTLTTKRLELLIFDFIHNVNKEGILYYIRWPQTARKSEIRAMVSCYR